MPAMTQAIGLAAPALAAPRPASRSAARLADLAVDALIAEAHLTPKPALVDGRGSGAHADLDLPTMVRSANALRPTFTAMAEAAEGIEPGRRLRELLGAIGRRGERDMLAATGGSNAHRGAIWVLGLFIAAAVGGSRGDAGELAGRVAGLACISDGHAPDGGSHGLRACGRYGVAGARGEAMSGFPAVVRVGLPMLRRARDRGLGRDEGMLDSLMAIMAMLDDTCLLHRGGRRALAAAKDGAAAVLAAGGTSTPAGLSALASLDAELLAMNASPGGSADMLAASIFLDWLGVQPARSFAFGSG